MHGHDHPCPILNTDYLDGIVLCTIIPRDGQTGQDAKFTRLIFRARNSYTYQLISYHFWSAMRLLSRPRAEKWLVQEFSSNVRLYDMYYCRINGPMTTLRLHLRMLRTAHRTTTTEQTWLQEFAFLLRQGRARWPARFSNRCLLYQVTNSVELQHALYPMFSWYEKAAIMVLSDVTVGTNLGENATNTTSSSPRVGKRFRVADNNRWDGRSLKVLSGFSLGIHRVQPH